jgi:hypothetical protein
VEDEDNGKKESNEEAESVHEERDDNDARETVHFEEDEEEAGKEGQMLKWLKHPC